MAAENLAPKPIDPAVAQDLARLALDLSHNKETRREFGKLVKKAKPESPHANAFSDVDVDEKFEKFVSDREKEKIEEQQARVVERMNKQRAKLMDGENGRKYSEDDVKKIEALMEKKGIIDYEDGAILYAATLPPENLRPERDIPKHGSTWELPEFATFGKDPVKASRDVAYQVIDEFQRKQR